MHNQVIRCIKSRSDVYHELYVRAQEGIYTSYLRGKRCITEDLFFYEISASFQFPYYFGENWAALDECICDLEWLHFRGIFIVVDDFECIFSNNKEMQLLLVRHLENMVAYWKSLSIPVEVWLNTPQL